MLIQKLRLQHGFYVHLTIYLLVVSALAILNLWRSPGHLWFLWAAFGWGIGVLSHAISCLQLLPFLGPDWEKRQVEKRLGRPL